MVSTAAMRSEYPELVVSRVGPRCDFSKAVGVLFLAGGSSYPSSRVILRVHPAGHQAFRAQAAIYLHHGYEFRETAGGTLSCRYITGGSDTTLHAHGVAEDHNPSKNRYRRRVGVIRWGIETDMPKALVGDIERLRTGNNTPVFEWGGRWWNIKDPMHYELNLYRRDLATGINLATLPTGAWATYLRFEGSTTPGDPMLGFTIGPLESDSVGGDQALALQLLLLDRGEKLPQWGADGVAGDETRHALRSFQSKRGMVTGHPEFKGGIVGPYTYTWLQRGTTASVIDQVAREAAAAARLRADSAHAQAAAAKAVTDAIKAL